VTGGPVLYVAGAELTFDRDKLTDDRRGRARVRGGDGPVDAARLMRRRRAHDNDNTATADFRGCDGCDACPQRTTFPPSKDTPPETTTADIFIWIESKGSPYSITERRVPQLIPVLGSQPANDVSHKPGGRLPLLSATPAVILATLKRAAASFAAW